MNQKSVKFKITAYVTGCFLAGMILILLVMFFNLRSSFNDLNQELFTEMDQKYSNDIKDTFESPVSFLAGICSVAEAQMKTGNTDREALQQLILRAFDKYPISEGTAFMMEPNVYDGLDSEYKDTQYGTPTSGRISYYYFRENGRTQCLPQTEEDDQEFVQPYYLDPKEKKAPTYSDPYVYTFDGKSVSMITASYPMQDDAGNVLGVATVDLYLESIHKGLSDEKIFNTGYIVVVSETGSILYCPDLSLVGTNAADAGLLYEQPSAGESVRISQINSFINGQASHVTTVPLELSQANSKFYISIVTPDKEANAVYNRMLAILFVIFLLVGLVILVVVSAVTGRIMSPLEMFSTFIKKAGSTGDISISPEDEKIIEEYSRNEDEIGQYINSTAQLVSHLRDVDTTLKLVSEGDLTADINLLSDSDTLGQSMKNMTGSLEKMFTEIYGSTEQVSTAAKQISDSAQSLAQGATQQAASIEELSGSISEISQTTTENAKMADSAAELANQIMNNAEKGSQQMVELIGAVKEMNEASQSIGKIIKTIDDIAFQTNILALNAAVEAARAGQHGKGFAVVADEVRSLAAKSAEAAKDTSGLIENSMEKAEFGARIASETSASLEEIVAGINKSNQLISDIARLSDEQSVGTEQINDGIEQVAQVVQQNSAIAEESAAAAEEMNAQADVLQGLISYFKTRNSN